MEEFWNIFDPALDDDTREVLAAARRDDGIP